MRVAAEAEMIALLSFLAVAGVMLLAASWLWSRGGALGGVWMILLRFMAFILTASALSTLAGALSRITG